jgi:hypothetical protein
MARQRSITTCFRVWEKACEDEDGVIGSIDFAKFNASKKFKFYFDLDFGLGNMFTHDPLNPTQTDLNLDDAFIAAPDTPDRPTKKRRLEFGSESRIPEFGPTREVNRKSPPAPSPPPSPIKPLVPILAPLVFSEPDLAIPFMNFSFTKIDCDPVTPSTSPPLVLLAPTEKTTPLTGGKFSSKFSGKNKKKKYISTPCPPNPRPTAPSSFFISRPGGIIPTTLKKYIFLFCSWSVAFLTLLLASFFWRYFSVLRKENLPKVFYSNHDFSPPSFDRPRPHPYRACSVFSRQLFLPGILAFSFVLLALSLSPLIGDFLRDYYLRDVWRWLILGFILAISPDWPLCSSPSSLPLHDSWLLPRTLGPQSVLALICHLVVSVFVLGVGCSFVGGLVLVTVFWWLVWSFPQPTTLCPSTPSSSFWFILHPLSVCSLSSSFGLFMFSLFNMVMIGLFPLPLLSFQSVFLASCLLALWHSRRLWLVSCCCCGLYVVFMWKSRADYRLAWLQVAVCLS